MIKFKYLTDNIIEAFGKSKYPISKKKKNPFNRYDDQEDDDEEENEEQDEYGNPITSKDANKAQVGERPDDEEQEEGPRAEDDTTVGTDGESIYSLNRRMQRKMSKLGYDENGEYLGKEGGEGEKPGFDAIAGGETDPAADGDENADDQLQVGDHSDEEERPHPNDDNNEDEDENEEDQYSDETEDEQTPPPSILTKKKKPADEDKFSVARRIMRKQ